MRIEQGDTTGRSRERGASAVEYGSVLLLIGAIIAALLAIGVPGTVGTHVKQVVCQIFGGDCPGDDGTTQQPPPTTTPSPTPTDDRTETEAVLNETQLGRDALQWAHDHGVRIEYRAGGGSYYDDGDNVFYVDTEQSAEERANTFVHEINHAEHRNQPDINSSSREDYVNQSIDEETEGTVEAIQNNQQLQETRGGSQPDTLLQGEYETAYDSAVAAENKTRAQAGRAPLTPEEERQVGEEAGRRRVREAFDNGEVVTSTTGDSYPDYYGNAWDGAH